MPENVSLYWDILNLSTTSRRRKQIAYSEDLAAFRMTEFCIYNNLMVESRREKIFWALKSDL